MFSCVLDAVAIEGNRGIHVELSLPETRRSIGYENERHRCGKSARGYVHTRNVSLYKIVRYRFLW